MKSLGGDGQPVLHRAVTADEALRYAMRLPVATTISGIDALAVFRQTLAIAQGFKAMAPEHMQALRQRCPSLAADGPLELYKSTDNGATGREQHGYLPRHCSHSEGPGHRARPHSLVDFLRKPAARLVALGVDPLLRASGHHVPRNVYSDCPSTRASGVSARSMPSNGLLLRESRSQPLLLVIEDLAGAGLTMTGETFNNLPSHPRVALLGAGIMGAGMAQRMLDLGFPVNVWNRTPRPAAALAAHGATVRAQATDAVAAAEVVVTMLPNADAVADVMLQGGTLDALPPNATWAQMGTIGVEATERLAAEVARRRPDVVFVDAPVSGSREPARNGRLLILASGPDRSHDAVDAVFEALGQRTLWLGPAGTASRLKLVLNAWLAFETEAAAEVGALAERLGIPYKILADAVTGGPLASTTALTKLAKMEQGDYSADFALEWALKDLDLALADSGADTVPLVGSIAERWRGLVAQGYGHLDISAARLGLNALQLRKPATFGL